MTDKFDIRKKYDEIKAKYRQLPDFDKLNQEFEMDFIEKEHFLLRQLRRRVNEKIIFFCRVLEGILFPAAHSAINAYESENFMEEQRKDLSELHKQLMVLERRALALDIDTTDQQDVDFICDVFKAWPDFKVRVHEIAVQMQKAWTKKSEQNTEKGYYG